MSDEQIKGVRQRVEALPEDDWYLEVETFGEQTKYWVQPGVARAYTDIEAVFIAQSREDVVTLLEEVEKLRDALMQIAVGDTWTAEPHDIAAWALGLKKDDK